MRRNDDEELEEDAAPAPAPVTGVARELLIPERPVRDWNRPPAEPIKPPPVTGTGPVVEVRKSSDLKNIKSNTTYQWMAGYVHREQVSMNGLVQVTFIDPVIIGAYEANIYARNFNGLTIRGGELSRSETKHGILVDGDSQGLRMYNVVGEDNEEHFIYYGAHKKGGTPYEIEDCIGRRNHRCCIQINLEGRNWWVVGGHILRCTSDKDAQEQGAAFNLGAWDKGLFKDNIIANTQDDGVVVAAIDGKSSRNLRIENCDFRNIRDTPLKCVDGATAFLSGNRFDEMPKKGGWKSDGTNIGPNGKRF